MAERAVVLILHRHFLPGYRFGGSLRSLANLCTHLGDRFDFRVLCLNHDFRDATPFANIVPGTWVQGPGCRVMCIHPRRWIGDVIRREVVTLAPRLLYLNSYFDRRFTITPLMLRILGVVSEIPVLVAPRGEFSPGALGLKNLKKRVFMAAARLTGLYSNVHWHATTEQEARLIAEATGAEPQRIHIAPNIPSRPPPEERAARLKVPGELRVVFLSRVARKKNLVFAINSVGRLRARVTFDIFGPIEDEAYWKEGQGAIRGVPENVAIRYGGSVPPAEVTATLRQYDVFFLPTLGENFGHAIYDALAGGVPVVVSDRTPWRSLAGSGAGFDLPLEAPQAMVEALQRFADMDHPTWMRGSNAALLLAQERDTSSANVETCAAMLARLCTGGAGP